MNSYIIKVREVNKEIMSIVKEGFEDDDDMNILALKLTSYIIAAPLANDKFINDLKGFIEFIHEGTNRPNKIKEAANTILHDLQAYQYTPDKDHFVPKVSGYHNWRGWLG